MNSRILYEYDDIPVDCISKLVTYITHNAAKSLSDITEGDLSDYMQLPPEPQKTSPSPVDTLANVIYKISWFVSNWWRNPFNKLIPPYIDVSRYHQLLDEIHQCYLDQREQLLSPSITSTITDLTNQNSKDHCALVRFILF